MRRRAFLGRAFLVGGAVLLPFWSVVAQQVLARPILIAALVSGSDADDPRYLASLRRGLKELGYTEGRDYVLEIRSAEGSATRLQDLARASPAQARTHLCDVSRGSIGRQSGHG